MTNEAEPNKPIRVLLISEYGLTASEVESNLAAHSDEVEFIGDSKSGQEGIDKALALSPDVVLISAYIDMHTDEVVRRLRAARPELHIITGSLSNNPQFISGTLDAGADDYICLPLFENDLLHTIRRFRDRTSLTLKAYIEQQRREQAESTHPDSLEP